MADQEHTGGMIALVPAAGDAAKLAVRGGDEPDDMHLTLAYLGDDVNTWGPDQREHVLAAARQVAESRGPVDAAVMGHAAFNPNGDGGHDPCMVYLVSGDGLPELADGLREHTPPDARHPVFLPHVTGGYGLEPGALSYTGPIRFDGVRVALAGDDTIIPFTGENLDEPDEPDDDDTEVKSGWRVGAPPLDVMINEGGDILVSALNAAGVEVKAKVASKEGERRYGKPIGTELGQARNDGTAKQAQGNARARDQYETLVNGNPRDYRKMLDDLSDADLKSLTAITYSFRSTNPKVVQARLALAAALRRKGLDVNDYGGLGKSGKTSAKAPARGRAKRKVPPRPKGAATGQKVRSGSADQRGVASNEVSKQEYARLGQSGWKAKPGDKSGRLYPPAGKGLDTDMGDDLESKGRTTTKPWETRKAQRGGKTIGADKSDEKGGGDEYPVKTIGDLAAGVKRARAIKDPDRRKEVLAHLRKGAKAIGGPAVNMVPSDEAAAKPAAGKPKKGVNPFAKKSLDPTDLASLAELDDWDPRELARAIELKVMSPDPNATRLREYWAHGKGVAKWRPGTPGDFDRLRKLLAKHVPPTVLNGLTANIHKLATGEWPGKNAHGGKTGEPDELESKSVLTPDDLHQADVLLDDPDADTDDDAISLALDRYGDMADELTSQEAYEQAMADEVDWTLNADGTLSVDDSDDDDGVTDVEREAMGPDGVGDTDDDVDPDADADDVDPMEALEELFAVGRGRQ